MTISASVGTSGVVLWLWRNADGCECQKEDVDDGEGMPGSAVGAASLAVEGMMGYGDDEAVLRRGVLVVMILQRGDCGEAVSQQDCPSRSAVWWDELTRNPSPGSA